MMEISRPIIWLAAVDWDPSAAVGAYHITRQLSKFTPVLFCNSIGIRRPTLAKNDIRKIWSKLWRYSSGVRNVSPNLWVLSPLGFPASLGDWTERANYQIVTSQIAAAAKRAGFQIQDAILWVSFPGWYPVVKRINHPPEQLVLHFFDRWEAYGLVDKEKIVRLKLALLACSGAVLACAAEVVSELGERHPKTYHAPHGFSAELFVDDRQAAIPPELSDIPRPIAGFFGTIDSFWIDFNLLLYCATAAPHISWVFIGMTSYLTPSDQRALEELQRLPNVHFLGKKAHQDLPDYGWCFSVGLLPFKTTRLTQSASPLKLLEYLALGLPVISTTQQQYGELNRFVEVAGSDPEQFLKSTIRALEQAPEDRTNRKTSVKQYDWPEVVQRYVDNLKSAGIDL